MPVVAAGLLLLFARGGGHGLVLALALALTLTAARLVVVCGWWFLALMLAVKRPLLLGSP